MTSSGFRMLPLFYTFAERLPSRLKPIAKASKGFEHAPQGMRALFDLAAREKPDVIHFQWIVLPVLDRVFSAPPGTLGAPRAHGPQLRPLARDVDVGAHAQGPRRGAARLRPPDPAHGDHPGAPARPRHPGEPPQPHAAPRRPATPRARGGGPGGGARARGAGPILMFGSLKSYKGVDVLARAGLRLATRRRDFRITITGKPFFDLAPLRAEIAAAAGGRPGAHRGSATRASWSSARGSRSPTSSPSPTARSTPWALAPAPASSASRWSPRSLAPSPSRPRATTCACCRPRSPEALANVIEELIQPTPRRAPASPNAAGRCRA